MFLKRFKQQEAQYPKELGNVKRGACFVKEKDTIATLAIIPKDKETKQTLALLDPVSTATICSEKLMNELECKEKVSHIT